MPALASEELSDQVAELYREHGVELLLGEQIQEFRANGRSLTGAVTASGQEIEAFLAVVGVGVEPETGFLEGSGLELDNGIVVDDHFRASVEDVYAIGDVARFDDTVAGAPAPDRALEQRRQPGALPRRGARRGRPHRLRRGLRLLHEAVRPPAAGARRPGRRRRRGRDSRLDRRPQPARVPPARRPARRCRRRRARARISSRSSRCSCASSPRSAIAAGSATSTSGRRPSSRLAG